MRRLLLLASAIVFVDTLFFAAISPLLPSFSDEFGLSKGGAGVLLAAYPAGTFIGALPGGWIAARAGVQADGAARARADERLEPRVRLRPERAVLDVARFVQGIGGAFSWAGALGWLIGAAPRERRGRADRLGAPRRRSAARCAGRCSAPPPTRSAASSSSAAWRSSAPCWRVGAADAGGGARPRAAAARAGLRDRRRADRGDVARRAARAAVRDARRARAAAARRLRRRRGHDRGRASSPPACSRRRSTR